MMNETEQIDAVLDGTLALERVEDTSTRALASRAWQDRERRRNQEAATAGVTEDVAIVPFVATADDPEAAVKRLQGRKKATPEWATADGYLFVAGYSNDQVANALVSTRR